MWDSFTKFVRFFCKFYVIFNFCLYFRDSSYFCFNTHLIQRYDIIYYYRDVTVSRYLHASCFKGERIQGSIINKYWNIERVSLYETCHGLPLKMLWGKCRMGAAGYHFVNRFKPDNPSNMKDNFSESTLQYLFSLKIINSWLYVVLRLRASMNNDNGGDLDVNAAVPVFKQYWCQNALNDKRGQTFRRNRPSVQPETLVSV